ncbi:MAG: tetratricopeptide repeat protein [Bdellovibrionales bacterium]
MNSIHDEVQKLYRWPLLLLRCAQVLYVLVLGLILMSRLALNSLDPAADRFGIWFVFIIVLPMVAWVSITRTQLLEGRRSGWVQAVIISCIMLLSIFLPLAVASLVQLFKEDKKRRFEELQNTSPPIRDGLSATHIVLAGVIILALWGSMEFFRAQLTQTIGGGAVREFQVDAGLSIPQLYELGRGCNASGDMNCSRKVFKRLVELNPNDMTALANLGMTESKAGRHSDAVPVYELYFKRGGSAYDVMAYYASSLSALGKTDLALEWYTLALKVNPHLMDVAENITTILIEKGETSRAEKFIDSFVRANPSAKNYFKGPRERLQERNIRRAKEAI